MQLRDTAVEQAVKTINNRVDEMQVREMTVIGRGTDIIVEIPGADQAAFDRIRAVISRTARLEFRSWTTRRTSSSNSGLPEGIELKQSEPGYAGESARGRARRCSWRGAIMRRAKLHDYLDSSTCPKGREVALGRFDGVTDEDERRPAHEYAVAHVAPLRARRGHGRGRRRRVRRDRLSEGQQARTSRSTSTSDGAGRVRAA